MINSPAHWSAVANQHTGMHDTPHARDTVRLHLTNAPLTLHSFFFPSLNVSRSIIKTQGLTREDVISENFSTSEQVCRPR